MKIATLLFITIVSISSYGFAQTVTIGTQTWTAKNLDVATFRNGDTIPEAKTFKEWHAAEDNKQPAWCYYENDTMNGTKYGKLYNWYAINDARGIAPSGWHVPTDEEWTVLYTFLGGKDVAEKKMKDSSGWNDKGNNSSGFSGLPGGYCFPNTDSNMVSNMDFNSVGICGSWWSASDRFERRAWGRELTSYYSILVRFYYSKGCGLSVRLVKD